MNKKEFEKWVDETVRKYNADVRARDMIVENKTFIVDVEADKMAMARCHKDDKFSLETGLAIAYARLRGWEVPEVDEEPTFKRLAKRRRYWVVDIADGKAILSADCEMDAPDDESTFKNNNYFHTRERAKEVADKINFLLKLERLHDIYCPNYKPDWNSAWEQKFYVLFDSENRKYISAGAYFVDTGTSVYFDSEETTQKVCNALNEDLEMTF